MKRVGYGHGTARTMCRHMKNTSKSAHMGATESMNARKGRASMNKPSNVATPQFKEIDPKKNRRSKRQLWCAYCGEWRLFKASMREHSDGTRTIGYKRCTGCGISDEDFWIKSVNKKWGIGLKPTGKGNGKR